MPATPVETTISGIRVSSMPLPFSSAQPLIPQIAEILSIASRDLVQLIASGKINPKLDVTDPSILVALFPALGGLAQHLDSRLEKLAPKILACTKVALESPTDGDLEWYELMKEKDRTYVFDEHPELYIPSLIHAGKVTFRRFFPAIGRSERGTKTQ